MSSAPSLEERVTQLEQQMSQVLEKIDSRSPKPGWISKITGSFENCPEFDEIVRLGREFRREMNAIGDVSDDEYEDAE
jgi:hypothetical protein